jgi:ketosteroid isomerase-like protein
MHRLLYGSFRRARRDSFGRGTVQNQTAGGIQMKTSLISSVMVGALLLSAQAFAGDDPKVAAEIMAMARGQWAAEMAGQSAADQMVSAADDYTEFNRDYPVRIEGKALNTRLSEATISDGSKTLAADMVNPKVQVYGDTAILSYNFVGVVRDKDGKVTPSSAKSTRVYSKMDGKWMLVHANFAPAASDY